MSDDISFPGPLERLWDPPGPVRALAIADQAHAGFCATAWRTELPAAGSDRLPGPLPGPERALLESLAVSAVRFGLRLCLNLAWGKPQAGPPWWLPFWATSIRCVLCADAAGRRIDAEQEGWPCAGCSVVQHRPLEELGGSYLWLPAAALDDLLFPADAAAALGMSIRIPAVFCVACRATGGTS